MSVAIGKRRIGQAFEDRESFYSAAKRSKISPIYPPSQELSIPDNIRKLSLCFPQMQQNFLENVLEECDDNLIKAIERLAGLKISDHPSQEEVKENPNAMADPQAFSGLETGDHNMISEEESPRAPEHRYPGREEIADQLIRKLQNVRGIQEAKELTTEALKVYRGRVLEENEQRVQTENKKLKTVIKVLLDETKKLKTGFARQAEKTQAPKVYQTEHELQRARQELAEAKEALSRERQMRYQMEIVLKSHDMSQFRENSSFSQNNPFNPGPDIF